MKYAICAERFSESINIVYIMRNFSVLVVHFLLSVPEKSATPIHSCKLDFGIELMSQTHAFSLSKVLVEPKP